MKTAQSLRATGRKEALRRPLAALLAVILGAAVLGAVPSSADAASSAPDHLVISAVFGSDGGAYNSDWVQLYNPTDHAISLGTISGSTVTPSYYQCYRSVTSTSCSSMKLYGTVLAHHTFLIWDGHNADATAGSSRGLPPAGTTPDLNFALDANDTAGSSTDPSHQSNNGFGGYSSGGQILLLDASSGGGYTGSGDLSSAAARSAGVVDAVAWTKYASSTYTQPGSAETGGVAAVTGASGGTSNAYASSRTFTGGVPVDTDKNADDFAAVTTFTLTSQASSRIAVDAVGDAVASRNQAMTPIRVHGSKGVGTLSYAATGLPTGVVIDPSTGIISGTPAETVDVKAYPVTVTVSDQTPGDPDTARTSFTLTLSNALRIDPLPDASVHKGEALTPIQVSARGGTPDYTYAATGLPAGVVIDPSTGLISGTPTDAAARHGVHVTVGDSGTGAAAQSVTADFTLVVRPSTTGPGDSDPLAGLRINEVRTTGTPADDWVELRNTGGAVRGVSVNLVDGDGEAYKLPSQDIAAGAFVVVDGSDLHASGLDLPAKGSLDLTESDDTVVDQASWTSHATTSWARYPDGTGDASVSQRATKGTTNAPPASLASEHLVISEVNGDQSGVYGSNWVELYNPTDSPIDLGTIDTTTTPATVHPKYFLCYSATASQSCPAPYKLYGTISPHHHFMVSMYNGSTTLPYTPTGVTPDIDFNSTDPLVNPSLQGAKNIGGYATGGQILLLDASVDTTGVYPTAANDTPANDADRANPGHVTWSPGATSFDLADRSINPSPVVDAMGFSKNDGTSNAHGTEGWTGTAVCAANGSNAASCVHSAPVQDASHWDERTFRNGLPKDTDDNAADFVVSQRDPISQTSEHVTVKPVADAEISLRAAMTPIQVQATKVWAPLTYAATGLPDGISIDPTTGVISGTPTSTDAVDAHTVTITVSDGVPTDQAATSFTLTVSKILRLDPIVDVSLSKGAALTPIRATAHGGTPGYAFAATGLPSGVVIDASTGVISGTPTDAIGHYGVHVTATDSGAGDAQVSVSRDFAFVELPPLGGPAPGDPLAGLTINEVKATGTAKDDWIELYNTGAALSHTALGLVDSDGDTYAVPAQDIAAQGFVTVDGVDLAAAGFDLAATDRLYLTESDGTVLDQTSWTSYAPTSWARTTDGAGRFAVSAYPTKGRTNSGEPSISPNDLLVSEVNYDNNSTDYYEYSEVTNTTDHPIDFAAYGLTLTKSGAAMTLHDSSDTSQTSPTVDPVIPAHGTQIFWWVENQYLGVKTTAQFLSNYGLPRSTPVVLAYGFASMGNSGGDHSYYLSINTGGSTLVSRAYVDTPCAANTFNGASVCTATNNNYAEHYVVPADRSNPDAAVWYNSLFAGGDDINHALKPKLSSPTTVDLEQVGFTRVVNITSATSSAVTLHNTSTKPVDLSGYVLQRNGAGAGYRLPSGVTVGAGADLVVTSSDSGLSFAGRDYTTLLAPRGYAYSDGVGIADTTGPLLRTLAYDASSGSDPVIDPTTGLPLPPAGGLYRPAGISARNGTVYVSNTGDNLLATVVDGSNSVIAGSLAGYGELGNEGPATAAQLYQPGGTALDSHGNIYVADSGDNVIRVITTDGKIHRFAGTGVAGGAGAAVTSSSTPLSVNLWHPGDVVVDSADNVFIADTSDNRVLEVTAAGAITVVAGTGRAGYTGDGSPAPGARLSQPAGVAVDADDNVYIADSSNNVVRRVDGSSGVITTVAGDYVAGLAGNDCLGGYSGDGGPATSALLNDPQGVAVDGAGVLFIADTFNHAIRQVLPSGVISTVVNVGAVAGSGNASPTGNGSLPASTKLNTPYALDIDPVTHALYIADTKNNVVDEVVNAAGGGSAAGPIEPADQVAVTGSGVASSACAALANGPVVNTDGPTVTGTLTPGATLKADSGTWSPTPDSFTYQWLRDGVAIDEATTSTYTVASGDAGHALSVAVTAAKEDFASATVTSAAVVIPVPRPGTLTTAAPAITGTVRVGLKVTAAPGAWRAGATEVTAFSYQWMRNGVPIPKATSSTYTVSTKDHRSRIAVRVTGSSADYLSASVVSSARTAAAGKLSTAKPRISGTAKVGRRVTARPGTWRAGSLKLTGAHLHYQWYADGHRISGAKHATYTIGKKYRGKNLTVKVTGSATGYASVARSSKHTAAVNDR